MFKWYVQCAKMNFQRKLETTKAATTMYMYKTNAKMEIFRSFINIIIQGHCSSPHLGFEHVAKDLGGLLVTERKVHF